MTFDRVLLNELTSLRFLDLHAHVAIVGPVGVGKTFLAHALGHIACSRGASVLACRTDHMLKRLKHARLDNSYEAELRKLLAVDLLVLDDFAIDVLDPTESRDLYEILTERHRAGSIIVTSNRGRTSGSRHSLIPSARRAPSTALRATPMISSSSASRIGVDSSPVFPRRAGDDPRARGRHCPFSGGSQIPPPEVIVAPGASSYTVSTAPWKSRTEREIPTFPQPITFLFHNKKKRRRTRGSYTTTRHTIPVRAR